MNGRKVLDPNITEALDSKVPKEISDIIADEYLSLVKKRANALVDVVRDKDRILAEMDHWPNSHLNRWNAVLFYIKTEASGSSHPNLYAFILKNPIQRELVLYLAEDVVVREDYEGNWLKFRTSLQHRPLRLLSHQEDRIHIKDGTVFTVGQ
jgi:hypothetical protein